MDFQSIYSNVQSEAILELETDIEKSLFFFKDYTKSFGTFRWLTLGQIQDTYAKYFKTQGINPDDIPPEVWIELRRTQSINLKLDFHLKDDVEKTLASTFESDWPNFLIILGWLSFFKKSKAGAFLKKKRR